MSIKTQVNQMDSLITQGEIIAAAEQFFADNLVTSDYGQVRTSSKAQTVEKLEGFLKAIARVNGITHHGAIAENNISASEFTFDFDMKDGSKVLWHEIIRRRWEDGQVVQEEYFNAQ